MGPAHQAYQGRAFKFNGPQPDRVHDVYGYAADWSAFVRPWHPSEHDLVQAREALARKDALREARQQKHELFQCILNKDLERVQALLKRLPSLLERHTPFGATPLIVAASVNCPPIVALLLEAGADVLAADAIGATALTMAASKGATEVIQQLLSSKMGGNAGRSYLLGQATKGGETAVMAAAKNGHTDTLRALLEAGAPHSTLTRAGLTALMLACRHNRVECAKVLLEKLGGRASDVDPQGRTLLMHAAAGGAVQVLEMLLALPQLPDVTQPDLDGLTALHHACLNGQVAAAELLCKRGAQPDLLKGGDGVEAVKLLVTAAKAGQGEMVKWLLDKGVGLQALTQPGGGNPIFAAVRGGSLQALDAMLAAGARLEVRDDKGRTPLAYAAALGLDRMCKVLVQRGASLIALDLTTRVPRQVAVKVNHRGTAQLLSELARPRLMVPDDQLEKEAPMVKHVDEPLSMERQLWRPWRKAEHLVPAEMVSTYQLR